MPERRLFVRVACGLAAISVLPPWSVRAQSDLAGVAYRKPEGWKETAQGDTRALVAPVARPGEMLMVLIRAAQPFSGTANAQLQSLADAAEVSAKRLSRGPVQAAERAGLQLLTMPSSVDQPGVGAHDRIYELVTDGRRAVFVVVVTRGKETLATQRTALMQLMQSIVPGSAVDSGTAVKAAASSGGIPYGGKPVNVLDKAFRPSGRGKPFPAPAIVDGAPIGPWWYVSISKYGSDIRSELFFPDGTASALFRPGGPRLADLEGMRALGEEGFIGRYHVSGGMLNVQWGADARNAISRPIVLHDNGEASSFLWFQREYQPALPITPQFLVGVWRLGAKGTYAFRADGSVVTTAAMIDAQWGRPKGNETVQGSWILDGYLLAMNFASDGDRVCAAFRTPHGELVLRQELLTRQ